MTADPDPDYYALLSVASNADPTTISKALVAEQRLWGARQNAPGLAARQEAERRVQLLAEVRHVLLDPSRRATYDQQMGACSATPPSTQLVYEARHVFPAKHERRPRWNASDEVDRVLDSVDRAIARGDLKLAKRLLRPVEQA